jgi:hypothetical protein
MTSTTTAKQIRRYIGHTDMLVLAEVNGTMWASNRIWLTRAEHVQPILDKHGLESPGGWQLGDGDVSLFSAEPPNVAKFLDLADYTVPLKNATIGDYEKVYTLSTVGYCEVFVNSDSGTGRYAAVRADWLDWLQEAPFPRADECLYEMRLATTERPGGPVAIIAEPLTLDADGDTASPAIVAVVMPVRRPEDAPGEDGDGPHLKSV